MDSLLRLENMGYIFEVDNEDVIFDFKSGQLEDPETIDKLFNDIKDKKGKVIEFLSERYITDCHKVAIEKGYLPYAIGECYGKQIAGNSEVYIQMLEGVNYWTAYRLTYRSGERKASSEKTIIEGNDFFEILDRTEMYIDNFISFIDKNV